MIRANSFSLCTFAGLVALGDTRRQLFRRAKDSFSGDRGDIPGWVMIAIMSAAVVVVLIPFVGPVIADAFSNAIDSVSNTDSGNAGQ
jgi:hypothetical protein